MAFRNIPLIGFLAPVLIAAYFPFRVKLPAALAWAPPSSGSRRRSGRLRAGPALPNSAWRRGPFPRARRTTCSNTMSPARAFDTYDQGGYLIWRLWPRECVSISDGHSLSETVYRDYNQILINAGSRPPADQVSGLREELLNRYGVQAVVMNMMDFVSGALYPLAIALANPISTEWRLSTTTGRQCRPAPAAARTPVLSNKLGRVLRHMEKGVRGIHRELSRHSFVRANARRLLAPQPGEGPGPPHAAPLPLTH